MKDDEPSFWIVIVVLAVVWLLPILSWLLFIAGTCLVIKWIFF